MDNGHNIVAGACFDFANYLTLLESPIVVGKEHEAPPVIDALADWAISAGLDIGEPLIRSWRGVIDDKGESEKEIERLVSWLKANMPDQLDESKHGKQTPVDVAIRILSNLVSNHSLACKRIKKTSPNSEEGRYLNGYHEALEQLRTY